MTNSDAASVCKICGAEAKNKYLAVVCCESCKAFFRRTSVKGTTRCPYMSKCDIDVGSRKICRPCRLQKCYQVGLGASKKKENTPSNACREKSDPLGQPMPMVTTTPAATPAVSESPKKIITPPIPQLALTPEIIKEPKELILSTPVAPTPLTFPTFSYCPNQEPLFNPYLQDFGSNYPKISQMQYIEFLKTCLGSYDYYNLLLQQTLLPQ